MQTNVEGEPRRKGEKNKEIHEHLKGIDHELGKMGHDFGYIEMSKLTEQLTGKEVDDKMANGMIDKLARVFVESISQRESIMGKAYQGAKDWWDGLSIDWQKRLVHGEKLLPISPGVFDALEKSGLITLHEDASPEARTARVQKSDAHEKTKEKVALTVTEVVAPEFAEFAEVAKLLLKLKGTLKEKVFAAVRTQMDTLKVEHETQEEEQKVMPPNNKYDIN